MSDRGYIGQWKTRKQAQRKPIKAVDGVLGIVMMLAYYAGGKNLFPEGVDPEVYIEGVEYAEGYGRAVYMDDDLLSGLCEAMSDNQERLLKSVTSGSLKVYLSHLRNGKYPNGGGICPAFSTAYLSSGQLIIHPRNWEADVASGDWDETPAWLQQLVVG